MLCRLCLREAPLVAGHSIPHWVFTRAHASGDGENEPIIRVGAGVAYYFDRQHTAPIACEDCEGRMGVWDDYGARISAQLDDSFPALENARANMLPDAPNVATVPSIERDVLTRFATAVLWRAGESAKFPGVSFGADHADQLRYYLSRDDAPFPANAVLVVHLLDREMPPARSDVRVDRIKAEPVMVDTAGAGVRVKVVFFGLELLLAMGPNAEELEPLCFPRTGRVSVTGGEHIVAHYVAEVLSCEPRSKLAKE